MRIRNLAATAAVAATLLVNSPAVAAPQPYGGCDEAWQAPKSAGAQECRDLGYTVHRKFVLNPARVPVAWRVDSCRTSATRNVCFRAFDTSGYVLKRSTGRRWHFEFND